MFGQTARVAVKDDRLGCDFRNVLYGAETAGHINEFNVRLAFRRGIAEGGNSHGIELMCLAVFQNGSFLRDETCQTRVRLDGVHTAFHGNEPSQSSTAVIRHGKLFTASLLQFRIPVIFEYGYSTNFPPYSASTETTSSRMGFWNPVRQSSP